MISSHRALLVPLAAACLVTSSLAPAQEIVVPRTADKSQVRYFDFDWRHVDILVGPEAERKLARPVNVPGLTGQPEPLPQTGDAPLMAGPIDGKATAPEPSAARGGTLPPGEPDGGTPAPKVSPWLQTDADGGVATDGGTPLPPKTGGVRLYYYEREAPVAERATVQIVSGYRHLVEVFDYVPAKTFPYILYNSYQEFLETNLFPLQEGVLGVTSPVDLKLTLPYFGDHRMFERVSLHEMAHQFTIQKVRSVAEKNKIQGQPLEGMPLWFIEGLAEYYAQGGVDEEAEMLTRDIVVNPALEKGYALLDFFEDRPQSGLWTYKVGQVRCAFLEETYGAGIIQRVLDASTALVGSSGMLRRDGTDFGALMERLTGDDSKTMARKFEAWLKRRAFKAYLGASQGAPEVKPLATWDDRADSMASSPDGDLLLYRTLEPETYRGRLRLMDRRAPDRPITVVEDGVPGTESLHLVFGRSFAVGRDSLIYVAQAGGADVIAWRKIDHRITEQPAGTFAPGAMPFNPTATANRVKSKAAEIQVQLSVGREVQYVLRRQGLIAAYGPALAPDGRRVAFVGLDDAGVRDIYVLTPRGAPGEFDLQRVTDDLYGERQVAWGPDDSLVFTSDATSTRNFNLFRVKLSEPGKKVERLTSEDRDEMDPAVLPDGRVLFVAYSGGSANLHEVRDGQIFRRTNVATGLFDVGPGPEGGVWALFHHEGERQPVVLGSDQLLSDEPLAQGPSETPGELASTELGGSQPYTMFKLENWELGNPYAFISGGVQGIYGQIFANAADRLRNHGLILFASVYGSFDLTDGFLVYLNQERRVTWGTGIFQSVRLRYDQSFPGEQLALQIFSGERFTGALGTVRYPFNRFVYVQGDLGVGAVSYFLSPLDRFLLATPEYSGADRDLLGEWNALNRGPRLQAEATVRLGYDTLRYHPLSGPLDGSTFLVEATGGVQPFGGQTYGSLRLDAAHYLPIEGRVHLMVRGGAGMSVGGRYATNFQLSSFDTVRGVPFSSSSLRQWLFGRNYFFSTAEVRVPLNAFIRLILFSDIEAIAALDFGGVSNNPGLLLKRRVLDYVLGVNFSLGPLQFRLHFAKPVGIGALPRDTLTTNGMPSGGFPCSPLLGEGAGGCPAEPDGDSAWVTNFSIGVAGLPGFFDRAPAHTSPHR